jgi:putative transport protein
MARLFQFQTTPPVAHAIGVLAFAGPVPPAPAFVSELARSDAPMVTYAMIYPLTMLLRILAAQKLALLLSY